MTVDPRSQGNGGQPSLPCRAVFCAAYVAAIVFNVAGCAADMPEHAHRVTERQLPTLARVNAGETRPLVHLRFDPKLMVTKEDGTDSQRRVAKVRLPVTTGLSISPRPRGAEKMNTPSLTGTEKEQLFREFLQWQKPPTDMP
jgi:hypothetical protein